MLDRQGFRLNVGIILVNTEGEVFWGKRVRQVDAWQFPQGGIQNYETLKEAMYRELTEELGLMPENVKIIAISKQWLYYRLPKHLQRNTQPLCVGQKQKWFLLQLVGDEQHIRLDHSGTPEFDQWRWVNYWYPVDHVISFKRQVYKKVLQEFEPFIKRINESNYSRPYKN